MYFFERYLHSLKLKVKNKARAEGSMEERYIEEECITFAHAEREQFQKDQFRGWFQERVQDD